MDKQKATRHIVIGLKAAIIATFPEDENLILPSADVPFTDESERLLASAASAFYDMIPADLMPRMELMGAISVGIDFWLTCSGSGSSFDDRSEMESYEKIGEFVEEIRKKFFQFEHAEVWYDVTNNEMHVSIYQPNF